MTHWRSWWTLEIIILIRSPENIMVHRGTEGYAYSRRLQLYVRKNLKYYWSWTKKINYYPTTAPLNPTVLSATTTSKSTQSPQQLSPHISKPPLPYHHQPKLPIPSPPLHYLRTSSSPPSLLFTNNPNNTIPSRDLREAIMPLRHHSNVWVSARKRITGV